MCDNHDYCYVEMPEKDNKILKHNYRDKSMKIPLIIYVDLESKITKISYKIKFIDSFRFMSSLLSNLVDNLSEWFHSDKCTNFKPYLDYITA